MRWPAARARIGILLLALVLLAGLTGHLPIASADGPTREQEDNAILATMKVWTLDGSMKIIAGCTGTVVDPTGYVLTNFHCVGITSDDKTKGKPGTLYNPRGLLAIGPTLDPRKSPKPTYIAKFIVGNYDLDVAVLKITGMVSENEDLPDPLPLVAITRSDSDQVQIGDYVDVIGYPGVGGNTITVTDGKIAGFDDMNGDGTPDSFKVTASINPGNSGGLAIDQNGNQIGIPTWSLYNAQTGSKLDRILMINVAEPYIEKALNLGGAVTEDTPPANGQSTVTPPSNSPSNSTPAFGDLKFGTDYKDGHLVNAGAGFPSGTKQVVGAFQFEGMDSSVDWGRMWSVDGQAVAGKSSGYAWEGDTSGIQTVSLYNDKGKLPDGNYKLTLYVNGSPALEGSFKIGLAGQPPKPQTPPPPSKNTGVVLKGQVVDADTRRGIPDAYLTVFKPGVTAEQITAAVQGGSLGDLVVAAATTDGDGNYQTAPPLARGQTYSVLVVAKGYQLRFFADGLQIAASDPAVTKMEPVVLQQE